jgi:hypothetical protein
MNTQNGGIVEKIAEALSPSVNTKGEDYLKIWESWGMTKQEWAEVETKRATKSKITMQTADGTKIGEVVSIKES